MSKISSLPLIEAWCEAATSELQDPWKTLLDIAHQGLREQNYDESERIAASVYNDLIRHVVYALNISAKAFLAKKKYAKASKVALRMKRVCPEHIAGYLRMIEVHLVQDNTKPALEVCEDALLQFPPSSDEHKLIAKIKTEIHRDSFVDFVRVLPLDVLEIIFGHFDVSDLLFNCVMVSKLWRQQLLQCPSLWKHNSVIPRLRTGPIMSPAGIAAMEKYVRSIEAEDERGPWIASLCSHLSSQKFSHLDTLVLSGGINVVSTTFGNSIAHFPKTLRTLKLTSISDPSLSLQLLLLTFPNLFILEYQNFNGVEERIDTLPPRAKNLMALKFESNQPIPSRVMQDVVETCPNLRGLVISPCGASDTIPLVKRYCPNLRYLGVNPMYSMSSFLDNAVASSDTGLTHLIIGSTTSLGLEQGLKAYSDTLEEVWVCNEDLDRNIPLFSPFELRLEKLRKLVYYGRIDTNEEVVILDALLCSTTSLEVLHVNNYSAVALDMTSIYGRLAELPVLKELELHCYLESEGVETYLGRMVSLRSTCPLQSITLRHFPVTRTIFEHLADISTLRELTLWFPAYAPGDLAFFLERLPHSGSSVEMLHLHSRSFMTDTTLEALGRIPTLKRLTLTGYRTLRERGMLEYYVKKYESRFQMTFDV